MLTATNMITFNTNASHTCEKNHCTRCGVCVKIPRIMCDVCRKIPTEIHMHYNTWPNYQPYNPNYPNPFQSTYPDYPSVPVYPYQPLIPVYPDYPIISGGETLWLTDLCGGSSHHSI